MNISWLCISAAPYLAILAMGSSLFILLWRYFIGRPPQLPDAAADKKKRDIFITAAVWLVVSRLIMALALVGAAAQQDRLGGLLRNFESYWIRWDAPHYLGLAENGYVTEGDARFHIVFWPLFPALVRCVRWMFGGKTWLAACAVSNGCHLIGGWALGEATALRYDRETGKRAARLLMLCPYGVFFATAYTESLFVMLCALSLWMARKERFGWSVALGALAANTRLPGVIMAVPIFYEMLSKARREKLGGGYIARSALKVCGVLLGVAAYIALNYAVTGDGLKFLEYQREHWGQQLGAIWDTFRYTVENAFFYDAVSWRHYTWIPQAVCMLLLLLFLPAISPRRIYPGDGAYMWIYMALTLGTTWLISGARYIFGIYALYSALAAVVRREESHMILCVLFALLMAFFTCVYALNGSLL